MPVPAFVPLVMVWCGIGEGAKITIVFLGCFFQVVLMIADDARSVPDDLLSSSYTLGTTRWSSNSGIGYSILKAQRFLHTESIFSGILIIGILGLITDRMFAFAIKKMFPWAE